jgi:NAD(P)H-hydrate epimerase
MKKYGLPGITKEQMQEVDRLMMEDYQVPVELMMEHAGWNLARLAVQLASSRSDIFQVIAGSGNNGGGGLVAARRLSSWGLKTEVFFPQGKDALRDVPIKQLARLKEIGISLFDGIPLASSNLKRKQLVLDCYIGYGFKYRPNEVSDHVFSYLRDQKEVISLDTPSGLDVTSGADIGGIKPRATMTVAFVKQGLLKTQSDSLGELYIVDIGVPSDVYEYKLGIDWIPPFDTRELENLRKAFSKDSLQRVSIQKGANHNQFYWEVN